MGALGIEKSETYIKELGRTRKHHDRELTLEVTDATGCGSIHRYLQTGGIDYLLGMVCTTPFPERGKLDGVSRFHDATANAF